ncbi:uncharacterized protein LOC133897587 [Phragmites australis]|uniref:uncharacterized protein LOC133897587 n=1 Tax=Phragmites australis TaxID=29695 RepID=UPI002D776A72|nr:uncharacterized protein LOC133897587 [Phragmites australis]
MASPNSALNASSIAATIDGIEQLTGNNFPAWKAKVTVVLGVLDLDYALRVDAPTAPAIGVENYDELKKTYDALSEKWERSNRMSLMIMRNSISDAIRGAIPNSEKAKTYLASVEEQFKGTSKVYASTLIQKLLNTKYNYGSGGIREHIMMMTDMAAKLKGMDMEISESFLVHFIMTSLPPEFTPFKINYNTQKEKWSMSDLIAMCVQEEERVRAENKDFVNQVSSPKNKRKFQGDFKSKKKLHFVAKHDKAAQRAPKAFAPSAPASQESKDDGCHFCHKKDHYQKDCVGFLKWLAKKGIPYRENIKKGGAKS